ncbi:unnamed protein product [Clonostachys rhizophaga]|uniref:Alpha-1,3-mannosyltransferase CMT1 n=1 Tax=Clonostachys rhizophaga TaxID=160324 RepID=A0A9N9V3F3_9HYPO|nr:unnamed protein product [Clonostachys rhizophaga]
MGIIPSARRLQLRRITRHRISRILLLVFALVSFFDVLQVHHGIRSNEEREPTKQGSGNRRSRQQERIYITGLHYNDGELLRNHWMTSLLELCDELGPSNVFVSLHESGSWDDTKEMLRWLDQVLEERGVARHIEVSDESHQDVIDQGFAEGEWVETSAREKAVRRIPHLARLRNKTLQDLIELNKNGVKFDKVLFLNDVVFTTEDVMTLMETNGGEYAAACSLDFDAPPIYYDTFALRDSAGRPDQMLWWPYFRPGPSRDALMKNIDAVPVTSCWNGIVVMPAEPFVSSTQLRFRAIPNSLAAHHLEGSECCLIHADNPLSKSLGVYLNPRVRVGYNKKAYDVTHPKGSWISTWAILRGLWVNRLKTWTTGLFWDDLVQNRVISKVKKWEKEAMGNSEPGVFCLINEMHVLVWNGWAHI